jgi:hypothetical protein
MLRLPTPVRAGHRIGTLGNELGEAHDADFRRMMETRALSIALVLRHALAVFAAAPFGETWAHSAE